VPDNTLGAESSVVIPNVNINGIPSDRIDGGATRGANLFHSFSQFNIGEGQGAYFNPQPGIENILSRVTGANRSDILGRLGVLGDANLFLINPNGIVFGQDASLDVQGSFLATTADALKLGNAGLFSASQPATSNLLTVSPSALWFNAIAAQPIVNRSRARSLIGQPNSAGLRPGLQVQTGRTLALIGGDVLLEGGRVTAAGGRIELGSVTRVGQVSLTQTGNGFVLGYDSINDFGNILLSNGAFVDASGEGGGDVHVRGGQLEMRQDSDIWADTLGAENGGEVLVRATEVELSENSRLSAVVRGTGTGGDLTIETGQLLISDGALVGTGTINEGAGGKLTVLASERVQVTGTDVNGTPSFLTSQSAGKGNAGELTIETGQLLISDGAQVSTGAFDEGAGGNLTVLASERVQVTGTDVNGSSSFLSSTSQGKGDTGEVTIETGQLLISDGARVTTSAFNEGAGGNLTVVASERVQVTGTDVNGSPSGLGSQSQGKGDTGEVTIETGQLLISDGAVVSTGAFNEGAGGNLTVVASEWVEVTGTDVIDGFPSALVSQSVGQGDAGEVTIETGQLLISDGALVSTSAFDEGAGGKLNINTGRLLALDGGQIVALTRGVSSGGNLNINASESVEVIGTTIDGLPSQIIAASGSISGIDTGQLEIEIVGPGGNLTIYTGELTVKDGAQVSVNSNTSGNAGNLVVGAGSIFLNNEGKLTANSDAAQGGNITLQVKDLLLARHNSEISAQSFGTNSVDGNINIDARAIVAIPSENSDIIARSTNRGNIDITAKGLFGFEFREQLTPESDITATGRITTNLPDIDISQELAQLPSEIIDTDSLIAGSCIVRRSQPTRGSFTITGTGGLPQRPGDAQMSSFPTVDIETLPSDSTPTNTNPNRPWQKGDPIVEPQGVYRLPDGKLVLSRECS
jgi:filamentous hemagglutinin family protein